MFSCKCTETRGWFIDLKPHLHTTSTSVNSQENKTDECRQFFLQRTHAFEGYFQMSLPVHLAFVKRSWPEACIVSQGPRYVGLGGGGL